MSLNRVMRYIGAGMLGAAGAGFHEGHWIMGLVYAAVLTFGVILVSDSYND